jgi:hypothetical protein
MQILLGNFSAKVGREDTVSHLKRSPNYNSICKLWWHQYNKTNKFFCSFYLLQQMSTAFSKTHKHFLCPEILLLVGVFVVYLTTLSEAETV